MKKSEQSKNQSALLTEAIRFGELIEKVVLVYFGKQYVYQNIRENVTVITLPYIDPSSPLRFAISILGSYIISIPTLIRVGLKYKINLYRADDIVSSGFPCLIASKVLARSFIVNLLGDVEDVLKYKIKSKLSLAFSLHVARIFETIVIGRSDACIAVNKIIGEKAKKFASENIHIAYPNIDLYIHKRPDR